MALYYLPVLYRDTVLIINTFARKYRTGYLAPIIHQVQSRSVEDAICSIGQALADMGALDPRLKSQGELEIRLKF